MPEYSLSKPQIRVNDVTQGIIPNSSNFEEGDGETTVRTASAGGNSITVIISDSAEDKKGKIAFELPNTPNNMENVRLWKKQPGLNVIEVSGILPDGSDFGRTMNSGSIVNSPEWALETEGKATLEWEGEPLI